MKASKEEAPKGRSFVVSLDNRKRRGAGHERAAEILDAARELFLAYGVTNVTTRQIAAKVGISQTAVYSHFATKDEMLERLANDAWSGLGKAFDEIERNSANFSGPAAKLRVMLAGFMRFWLEHPDDFRLVFARKAMNTCESACSQQSPSEGRKLLERLVFGVEEVARSGELRQYDSASTMALSIWAAISGLVSLRLTYRDFPWPPRDEHIESMLDMIFYGCVEKAARVAPKALI